MCFNFSRMSFYFYFSFLGLRSLRWRYGSNECRSWELKCEQQYQTTLVRSCVIYRANDSTHRRVRWRCVSAEYRLLLLVQRPSLNADKSEVFVYTGQRAMSISSDWRPLTPSPSRWLVWRWQSYSFNTQVTAYSASATDVRQSSCLPESVAQTLARSLINSRLDYCNSLLYGASSPKSRKAQIWLAKY